jgi:threonine dehydrogenase-like Zn-dependent dehydrogenase
MQSIAVTEPGRLQVVEVPEPMPTPYQVRLRTEAVCLCNITDRKVIEGRFPGADNFPLLLGHETVGTVETVGNKVRHFEMGDRVVGGLLIPSGSDHYESAWGGFSQYLLAGDHQAMVDDGVATPDHGWVDVYEIMKSVPSSICVEDAVMMCTWREVLSSFTDFDLKPGTDVIVFGAGAVGLSFVKFARLLGFNEIVTIDPNSHKREKALIMGATSAYAPNDANIPMLAMDRGRPFDAVIDAVGKEDVINAGIPLIGMGSSICIYGTLNGSSLSLEFSKGPYNFDIKVHQWPTRVLEAGAQKQLVEWVENGQLSYSEFIDAEYPFREIDRALKEIKSSKPIKTLFRF